MLAAPAVPVGPVPGRESAERFAELFGAVYLAFHRRDAPRSGLSGASRGALLHLAMTGPLTVGEVATHLGRAQSVVSEIVDRLEARGLLEREADPADHRRTLVWLTTAGQDLLRADRQVLSVELLARRMSAMTAAQLDAMLGGLVDLANPASPTPAPPTPAASTFPTHPHDEQGDSHVHHHVLNPDV